MPVTPTCPTTASGATWSTPAPTTTTPRPGGEPPHRGVVVVGAGVDHVAPLAVVGQVGVTGILREGEVQDLHPREADLQPQIVDFLGYHPQVLGHHRKGAEVPR